MKPEEIIQYLEMVRPTENYSHTFSVSVGSTRHFGPGSQLNKDVSTAIDLAIEALEKQVEKRGKVFFGGWLDCPNCENDISGFEERPYYCPNCGQAIDWTEELE